MDEVPRALGISDIQSSPIGDESETRPLLVDVGLKFERAEMQMIDGCVVFH